MGDSKESSQKNYSLQEYNKFYTSGTFKYLRILVHSVGAAHFVYAAFCWKELSHRESWGGKFKYLTYLDVLLQGTYHGIALLNDFFGSNAVISEPVPFLRKTRDLIFSVLAFPVSQNISFTFWVLYTFDRELIFPRVLDSIFPAWLNYIVHSNVALFTFMDMLTCCRNYPKRKYGVFLSSLAMVSYIGWLHIARYYNGRWAYPILNHTNTPLRYFLFSTIIGLNAAFYLCGEFLNNTIWSTEIRLLQD